MHFTIWKINKIAKNTLITNHSVNVIYNQFFKFRVIKLIKYLPVLTYKTHNNPILITFISIINQIHRLQSQKNFVYVYHINVIHFQLVIEIKFSFLWCIIIFLFTSSEKTSISYVEYNDCLKSNKKWDIM